MSELPHGPALRGDSSARAENSPGHSDPAPAAGQVHSDEPPRWPPGSTLHRRLQDLTAIQLPGQTNRMALVFDPLNDPVRALASWPAPLLQCCLQLAVAGTSGRTPKSACGGFMAWGAALLPRPWSLWVSDQA